MRAQAARASESSALTAAVMAAPNAPSGIAQLRKSSEQNLAPMDQSDLMNIDDFIFDDDFTPVSTPVPDSTISGFASPVARSKQLPSRSDERTLSNSLTTAIPIKNRKESFHSFVPQSAPFPPHHQRHNEEFNYVTRHHRKTSIDERRVGFISSLLHGASFYYTFHCYGTWGTRDRFFLFRQYR
jgi:GATA-binding protein